jgi:hypothetical protein
MKDIRVKLFRDAVQRLAEALEAKVRVERWELAEAIPESLSRASAELAERLDVAKRLAAGQFTTSGADAVTLKKMRDATDRLLLAYGSYQANALSETPRAASMILEDELSQVQSETGAW